MGFKKEEIKVEEVKNEVSTNEEEGEEKEETLTLLDDNDTKEIIKSINLKREEFTKVQKKWRILGLVGTGIFLIFIITGFILVTTFIKDETYRWISYCGFGLVVVGFAVTLLFSKLQKNKVGDAASSYADYYYEQKAKLLFNIEGIKDVKAQGKFENKEEFLRAKFYKDIKAVRSRFGVNFSYDNKNCTLSETAGCIYVKNKTKPMFLGKFFICNIKYEKPTTILFQLKGKELSQPVDQISNLELKEGNDKYVIYSNDDDYKEYLNEKVLGLIREFKIKDPIIDVIVSIHENELSIGIDYIDEYVNTPIDKDLEISRISKEKADLEKILSIIKEFK